MAPPVESLGPFYEFQVHVPAEPLEEGYSRRRAAVRGRVLVQYVVDTLGQPDMSTLCLLEEEVVGAVGQVVAVLPTIRFRSAELPRGRRVAQVVQTPFMFH